VSLFLCYFEETKETPKIFLYRINEVVNCVGFVGSLIECVTTMSYHANSSFEEGAPDSTEPERFRNHFHLQDQPHHNSPSRSPPPPPPPPHLSSHSPKHTQSHPYEPSFPPAQSSSDFYDSRVTPANPPTQQFHPSAHPDSIFSHNDRQARDVSSEARRHRNSSSSRSINRQEYSQAQPASRSSTRRKSVGQPFAGAQSGYDQEYTHLERPTGSYNPIMSPRGGEHEIERSGDDTMQQSLSGMDTPVNQRSYVAGDWRNSVAPSESGYGPQRPGETARHLRQQGSYSSSTLPFAGGAATPGSITPNLGSSDIAGQRIPLMDSQHRPVSGAQYPYHDSPYQTSSLHFGPQASQADIDPQNIADDGDDGFMPQPKRKSMLGKKGSPPNNTTRGAAVEGSGAPPAGGLMATLGGLAGRQSMTPASSGAYDPVAQPDHPWNNGDGGQSRVEKSEWLSREKEVKTRKRWLVIILVGILILLTIVGAIVGGILGSRSAGNSGGGGGSQAGSSGVPGSSVNNAQTDTATNGDLNKDSAEIKRLMNNEKLHKVFPAIDYTPWGTQYPLCLTYPPSQNNITRDMAVLSQLTNAVRLYGTDCNQTEMLLHSIDRLGLDSMKVWLGVWIETNTTTNDRQLDKMYKILKETRDHSIFKGVIVGNEALYRAGQDKAASQKGLIDILKKVKSNFTSLGYDLPVATSDLGDNWDGTLVDAVDAVMSNIHPFFAGVPVEEAAGWTWSFWQNKDIPLTKGSDKPQIISETGWPSGGGNDCGTATTKCPTPDSGSVAGVKQMNIFMDDFVCQAMKNGTDYFWSVDFFFNLMCLVVQSMERRSADSFGF
jgi:exo-beta-1,3-glucanase (GH17 family)